MKKILLRFIGIVLCVFGCMVIVISQGRDAIIGALWVWCGGASIWLCSQFLRGERTGNIKRGSSQVGISGWILERVIVISISMSLIYSMVCIRKSMEEVKDICASEMASSLLEEANTIILSGQVNEAEEKFYIYKDQRKLGYVYEKGLINRVMPILIGKQKAVVGNVYACDESIGSQQYLNYEIESVNKNDKLYLQNQPWGDEGWCFVLYSKSKKPIAYCKDKPYGPWIFNDLEGRQIATIQCSYQIEEKILEYQIQRLNGEVGFNELIAMIFIKNSDVIQQYL